MNPINRLQEQYQARNPGNRQPARRPSNSGVFWRGADGKVYVKGHQGVNAAGNWDGNTTNYWSSRGFAEIADPNAPQQAAPAPQQVSQSAYSGNQAAYYDPVAAAQAAEAAARAAEAERIRAAEEAERNSILAELTGYRGRADETFNDLFSRIDQLARERRQRLDETYNEQDARYTSEFEQAIPEIDNAFAALGIGNSTYAGKRVDGATKEYEKSLQSSKKNREADLREVGEWAGSQRSALEGDKRNIFERLDRASKHNADLGELRGVRNEIGSQVNTLGGRKGAYTPGGEAMQTLERVSGRSSNFDDAMASLQGVLNSSMDTGTKDAAKTALIDNANLTDDEKRRLSEVQANNAYGRPATT